MTIARAFGAWVRAGGVAIYGRCRELVSRGSAPGSGERRSLSLTTGPADRRQEPGRLHCRDSQTAVRLPAEIGALVCVCVCKCVCTLSFHISWHKQRFENVDSFFSTKPVL